MNSTAETRIGVSFVIRTYNEERFLGRLLDVIAAQEGAPGPCEVIVVDSGSTDATVELAKSRRVKLLQIPKQQFTYSGSLNLGIEASSGELIVIISAHAIPSTNDWLACMTAHFALPDVVGVYCRELPWPDADWRELHRIRCAFGDQSLIYDCGTPPDRIAFSNAASCIRRKVWEQHPFVALPYSEDREWANWVLSNGYRLVYEADACVYHSHNETCRQVAHRLINVEKAADITERRSRTAILTFRQAFGWALRDLRELWCLGDPKPNRLCLSWECLVRSYYFLRDFNLP